MVAVRAPRSSDLVVIACLALSGAAGLVYEVAWIRRASLVFGSTTLALSTVLAVFLLGLALGSELFGRRSRALARPLRLLALLEAALALLAVASPAAFDLADAAYGHVYRAAVGKPAALHAARLGLLCLVLLPPTVLMGGTLPLACRQLSSRASRVGGVVGLLYAVNTLGAALGCAATGLVLLPQLGMRGAILLGAALNGAAAIAFAALARRGEVAPAEIAGPRGHAWGALVPALFFAVGAAALGYEVLWARHLALVVANTVHTYTLALAVVLVGIVLGSLLASTCADRVRSRALLFGLASTLSGLSALLLMLLPAPFWGSLRGDLVACFVLLLAPAVLSGACFPLAVRMIVSEPSLAGAGAGRLLAVNTLGGIAGSLAVGFVLLPRFGLAASLKIVTGASVAAGIVAWLALDRAPRARRLAVAALAAWLVIPRALATDLPGDFLAGPGEELVEAREGLVSNLAVLRAGDDLFLEIDRWWQGSARPGHQALAADVPMLLHSAPGSVLVVGVGAGQTAARFLSNGALRVECVDIEPAVFALIRAHFDAAWMDDPRVTLRSEDGRNHLLHTDDRYDVISLELGQVVRPGVASFYTLEFYRRARERLRPGGLLSQFVQVPFLDAENLRRTVATFLAAFPRALLWYNTSELLLIGSDAPEWSFDEARFARLAPKLRFAYWGGPEYWLAKRSAFLAGFLSGPQGLAALAGDAETFRDGRPELEYAAADVDHHTATNEIPVAALLREHLEPVEDVLPVSLGPAEVAEIRRVRERNLGDMVAQAHLRRAHAPGASAARAQADALAANPESIAVRRVVARSLHADGRLEEALAHYRFAVTRAPGDAELRNDFGAALAARGELAEALDEFEAALRLRPDFPGALENRDRARAALGRGAAPAQPRGR
jgi:spermidine synthase